MEDRRIEVEVNANKEYILIGDISVSMRDKDPNCGGMDKYHYMLEKFKLFIDKASEFDQHGEVDVILFGERVHVFEEVKLDDISKKLDKITFEGMTMLDDALDAAYRLHLDNKKEMEKQGKIHPGTVCFVFTDGAPTNRPAVKRIIADIANDIQSEDEFNITLLTVGEVPRELDQWLNNLHDDLEKLLKRDYDIFHCEKLENVDFLGAVNLVNHE